MKKRLLLITLAAGSLAACTTVSVTANHGARVEVRTDRIVSTLPVTAEGNTVPVSAMP